MSWRTCISSIRMTMQRSLSGQESSLAEVTRWVSTSLEKPTEASMWWGNPSEFAGKKISPHRHSWSCCRLLQKGVVGTNTNKSWWDPSAWIWHPSLWLLAAGSPKILERMIPVGVPWTTRKHWSANPRRIVVRTVQSLLYVSLAELLGGIYSYIHCRTVCMHAIWLCAG